MTTTEIRKKIAESSESDWFNSVEVTIEYPHIEFSLTLKGFSSIHKFVSQQLAGWEKLENIPSELNSSKQHFNTLKGRLDNFLNSRHLETKGNLENYWRTEKGQIQKNGNYFTYDSSQTEFLTDINNRIPDSTTGAYNYIVKTNTNLADRNNLIGSLLAYEFDLKDNSEITERRKKEKSSISKIKNDLRSQLSESETQLTGHLTKANQDYQKYVNLIDTFKSEKESLFNDWYDGTDENSGVKDKIAELENTYDSLLSLKKPAEYWNNRAKNLRTQGWISFAALIVFVVLVVWSLGELLWKVPEEIYTSFFADDKSAAIRWSIIYITFISFMAFCIKAITKVMFSSFHLARDSEERNTLTYFYLSLLNDSKVEKEDRQLIMQSLFSRADTGLLKDDSGPTMPNDFISKIINK
ncbi:hypothetical protein GCM10023314_19080 [Algibacter agarivorans]|uniref:DUF6161 domain-containing protein n=1 Tax=Algibacter agarivorans TaxID=1109741 RepID=A0ABP9GK84_9FLAO